MGVEAWFTLIVLFAVLALLVSTRRAPDLVVWGGVALLMIVPVPAEAGWRPVLTAPQGFSGLLNEGVLAIGVLYVVAAGLRETGGMNALVQGLMGRPRSLAAAQARLMTPTAVLSGFFNNTPLVAMLLPIVNDWARRNRMSISKLLMPLSFAAILGGTCTLMGTSSNLIVHGELKNVPGYERGFGLFEVAWIGLPIMVIGILYMLVTQRFLLPDRKPAIDPAGDSRRYTVEMMVDPGSPLAGKTIEQAGLRHLPGLFLIEIDRDGSVMPAVSSNVELDEGDRLVFAGIVESVVDLQKIRGLSPATDQVFKINEPRTNRVLVEAVVSNTCPLVGRTIREGRFRTLYNAAVIAVARNGEQIRGVKIGDIRLRAGDVLLLEARASFAQQQRDSRDFYLVSSVENSTPPRHERGPVALGVLAVMVVLVATGVLPLLYGAMVAAGLMVITRCTTATVARQTIDWQVLMMIAGAIGLGQAMETSHLAEAVGGRLIAIGGSNPYVLLTFVYGLTAVMAALVTAKASAALMFPIAAAAAAASQTDLMPYAAAVLVASATTIVTPIGFPTNLMVFGPGGYRFGDYLRFGGPLSIVIWVVTVLGAPIIWPFEIGG